MRRFPLFLSTLPAMFLRSLLIAVTLLTALPSAQADRRQWDDRERERDDRKKEEKSPRREMSLDQAVRMVERQHNAQVISTRTSREGDRTVYHLKLLNKDGKVW